jgi:hypothetical protein
MSTRDLGQLQDGIATAHRRADSRDAVLSLPAALALAALAALALLPTVEPTTADRVSFLLLAVVGAVCFWTRGLRFFEERAEAATFAITLVVFLIYGLARQAGPQEGWSLRLALLPDTPLVVPYAARIVVVAALVTAPLWWRNRNGWTSALLAAITVVALLGFGTFVLLGRFYTVGETEVLDPTPLVQTLIQALEFAALALVCSAACAVTATRRWILRFIPLVLFVLWARYQFFPAPKAEESE